MDLGLKDKRVILSGGSKGIGFYTAKLLVSEGCKVAFCSRNSESLKKAEAEAGLTTSWVGHSYLLL